jgi:hypothetical protein
MLLSQTAEALRRAALPAMPHFADNVKQLPGDSQSGHRLAALKMGIAISSGSEAWRAQRPGSRYTRFPQRLWKWWLNHNYLANHAGSQDRNS